MRAIKLNIDCWAISHLSAGACLVLGCRGGRFRRGRQLAMTSLFVPDIEAFGQPGMLGR